MGKSMVRRAAWGVLAAAVIGLAPLPVAAQGTAQGAPPGNPPGTSRTRDIAAEERDRSIVIRFYDRVFNGHDLGAAEEMLSADYIQHNPRVPTGRAAFIAFMANRLKQTPDTHSTILRSAVEGDLVYLHVHSVDRPGERGTAIINIFRVLDGKITEHWDVVQPVPDNPANANTMF